MDTAVVSMTTFQDASWSLRRRKMPTFDRMVSRLGKVKFMAESARILEALNQERFKEIKPKIKFLNNDECNDVLAAALGEITLVAPLDMEFIELNLSDFDGLITSLPPEPYGFPISLDEWESITQDLEGCAESLGLYVFFTALRLGEYSVLEAAASRFGWDFPDNLNFDRYGDVDWKLLFEKLDQAGLGFYKNAIDVCHYSTGNPYFDYNPYDEELIHDLPEYSLEGVRELQQEWIESKPILADFRRAEERFEHNPSRESWRLLKLYLSCCEKRSRARVRTNGKTLVEIFGEEEISEPNR
jgi:hypothetical protein